MKNKNIIVILVFVFITGCSKLAGKPESVFYKHYEGPKKIAIFTDGTNNDRDTRTNVRRLFEIVSNQDREDIAAYYDPGVGTDLHKITGNMFGVGLSENVKQAYSYLLKTHKSNKDEIYLFGFSRGAYTARVLSGLIYTSGLIDLESDSLYDLERINETGEIIKIREFNELKLSTAIYDLYKIYKYSENDEIFNKKLKAFKMKFPTKPVDINVIGVWDTVDATGRQTRSRNCRKHQNHHYKVGLHENIKYIYHAVSVDETRQVFWPVLYRSTCSKKNPVPDGLLLKEVWFPGVHSDIGGGYRDSKALPGLTLNWMLHNLEKHNLITSTNYRVYENVAGQIHESRDGTIYKKIDRKKIRKIAEGSVLHTSVIERMQSVIPNPYNYPEQKTEYKPVQFSKYADTEEIKQKYQVEKEKVGRARQGYNM